MGNQKKKIAWGITGSGDRLVEIVDTMKTVKERYRNELEIRVYLSKAGEQVVKRYKLMEDLQENFGRISVEIDSNSPFLAGALQMGRYEFLLIAPATSNTVAKISTGIADSLLTNAAIMGLKAFAPTYLMPSDYKVGVITTLLPGGKELKLRIRKEDVEHVKKLSAMDDIFILETPEDLHKTFKDFLKKSGKRT